MVGDKGALHIYGLESSTLSTHTHTQTNKHIQTYRQDVMRRANTRLEPTHCKQHQPTTAPPFPPQYYGICHQPALLHPGMQKMIGWPTMHTLFRLQYQTIKRPDRTTTPLLHHHADTATVLAGKVW